MLSENRKILIIFSDIDKAGYTGQPKIAMEYTNSLRKEGFDITVISNAQNPRDTDDFLHHNDVCFGGPGTLWTYIKNLRLILFTVYSKKFSHIILHGALVSLFMLPFTFFLFRVKLIFSTCEIISMHQSLLQRLYAFACKRATIVIVTSNLIKKELVGLGVTQNKIKTRLLGLDKKFILQQTNPEKNYDLLFFGDAKIDRGFPDIVKIANDLPDFKILILLRWVENDCLQSLKELRELKNVQIKYYPYPKDLKYYISISSMVVLPFRFMGVRPPLSIIESMAAGKVVISSDMHGNEDLIQHAHNGYIFSIEKQYDCLLETLKELKSNPRLIKSIGDTARLNILSKQIENSSLIELITDH